MMTLFSFLHSFLFDIAPDPDPIVEMPTDELNVIAIVVVALVVVAAALIIIAVVRKNTKK